ncbi:MAG: hypothetical protein PUC86_02055, partial [Solobacterium sp.]|nr:hypothetical protein [Solobacterium sp.]
SFVRIVSGFPQSFASDFKLCEIDIREQLTRGAFPTEQCIVSTLRIFDRKETIPLYYGRLSA